MPFEVVFGFAAAVVALGFVAVIALIIYNAVRSARDPEYRAYLKRRAATDRSRTSTTGAAYDPALDPGNPASPMFPSNPGNSF